MPAFLDIHLEQIAQIVKGRTGCAEQSLLLDRSWLRISLSHDDAPQRRSIFSWNILPGWFALMIAEVDLFVFITRRQKDAPSIVRHANVSEIRPAVAVHADRRSEVNLQAGRVRRPCFIPPIQ